MSRPNGLTMGVSCELLGDNRLQYIGSPLYHVFMDAFDIFFTHLPKAIELLCIVPYIR